MTGYTAKYWRFVTGTSEMFLICYLVGIFISPMLLFTFLTWLLSRRAYQAWQASWQANTHREGLSGESWNVNKKMESVVELVESVLAIEKRVWGYGRSRLRDIAFFIALVRGGNESCGMSKLYILVRDLGDEGVDVAVRGFKRFLAPYEEGKQVTLDSSTRRLILTLREGSTRDSGSPEIFTVSTVLKRKRAIERALLSDDVKKNAAEARRKAREYLNNYQSRILAIYGTISFFIVLALGIVFTLLILALVAAAAR